MKLRRTSRGAGPPPDPPPHIPARCDVRALKLSASFKLRVKLVPEDPNSKVSFDLRYQPENSQIELYWRVTVDESRILNVSVATSRPSSLHALRRRFPHLLLLLKAPGTHNAIEKQFGEYCNETLPSYNAETLKLEYGFKKEDLRKEVRSRSSLSYVSKLADQDAVPS
jgi:hypothetical protein